MKCKYLNNSQGVALVAVLMTLAILSILSVGTLSLTTSENKFSLEDKEEINSYALSKTGIEIVSKKLMKNPASVTVGTPITGTVGTGSFTVVMTGNIATNVKLTSEGILNGNSETTYLELINQPNPYNLFENAVYANNPLTLSNVDVTGPIQSGGDVEPPYEPYPFEIKDNSPMYYPAFTLPTSLISKGNVVLGNGGGKVDSFTINTSNWYYGTIDIENGKTLTLGSVGSTTSLNLVVDNLIVKGDIVVLSKVKLYVKNSMIIQTSGIVNTGSGADPNNLYIFLGTPNMIDQDDPSVNNVTYPEDLTDDFNPNGYFSTQAGQTINAYIYGPAALIETDSSNVVVSGGIISNQFNGNNNSDVNFVAPNNDPDGLFGVLNLFVKTKYTDQ